MLNELAGLDAGRASCRATRTRRRTPVDAILEEAAKFATEVLDPLNAPGDREGCEAATDGTVTTPTGFKDAYRQFCENGWNGLTVEPEYGGQGLPQLVATAGRGDVARVEHRVRAVPAADAGRDRGDRAPRLATR